MNKLLRTITEEILLFLVNVVKAPAKAFLETPYKCYIPKKQIYPMLYSLKKSGYIKKEGKNYTITPKGKLKSWYAKFKIVKINIKKWDGKWRILFFDVPEKKKKLREKLRRKLKLLTLIKLQNSVWVTPLPVEKDLEILSKILEIKYFIRYVVTDKLNFDNDLRKKFFK